MPRRVAAARPVPTSVTIARLLVVIMRCSRPLSATEKLS